MSRPNCEVSTNAARKETYERGNVSYSYIRDSLEFCVRRRVDIADAADSSCSNYRRCSGFLLCELSIALKAVEEAKQQEDKETSKLARRML